MSTSSVLSSKPVILSTVEASSVVTPAKHQLADINWKATKIAILKIASFFTEPICKTREYFYTFYILNELCKNTAGRLMQITYLVLGIVVFALLTPFTAPVGIALRAIVTILEPKGYIYLKKAINGKTLPENKEITLVSHNECYMPAGYSITDGQVRPPSDKKRMNDNIETIKKLDPDFVCLFEVPDICDADDISSRLPDHPYIIPVAGIKATGPSSMIYIASKYEIVEDSIEFVPFEKGTELTGRAQFSKKGFLSFDIKSKEEKIPLAIIATHLQHSEVPANPEDFEKKARAAEMIKIARHIQKKVAQGFSVIFTGDLNQEEQELYNFLKEHQIDYLRRDESVHGKPTWGGDKWCAELMKKPASGPQVLDYTFIAGKAKSISTQILGTGYSGLEFRPDATSDHYLLFNTVRIG